MASNEQWQKLTAGWTQDMVEQRMRKIDRLIDAYNKEYLFLNKKLECMENDDLIDAAVDRIILEVDYQILEEECSLEETEEEWELAEGSAPFDDELKETLENPPAFLSNFVHHEIE